MQNVAAACLQLSESCTRSPLMRGRRADCQAVHWEAAENAVAELAAKEAALQAGVVT